MPWSPASVPDERTLQVFTQPGPDTGVARPRGTVGLRSNFCPNTGVHCSVCHKLRTHLLFTSTNMGTTADSKLGSVTFRSTRPGFSKALIISELIGQFGALPCETARHTCGSVVKCQPAIRTCPVQFAGLTDANTLRPRDRTGLHGRDAMSRDTGFTFSTNAATAEASVGPLVSLFPTRGALYVK